MSQEYATAITLVLKRFQRIDLGGFQWEPESNLNHVCISENTNGDNIWYDCLRWTDELNKSPKQAANN